MSHPVLRIHNRHSVACGDPPIINNEDPRLYVGYFENSSGKQWIFRFDKKSRKGELRGGDVGWGEVHAVLNGKSADLVLNRQEAAWLQACWDAAVAGG